MTKRPGAERLEEIRRIRDWPGTTNMVAELLNEIDALKAEVTDWKGTHAHQCTESSIRIGGLEQERDHLRALLDDAIMALSGGTSYGGIFWREEALLKIQAGLK